MDKGKSKVKIGLWLVIISIPMFLSLLMVPFLKTDNKTRILLSTVIISVAEVCFWTGGFFLGKELLAKYKAYLNPANWFKFKSRR